MVSGVRSQRQEEWTQYRMYSVQNILSTEWTQYRMYSVQTDPGITNSCGQWRALTETGGMDSVQTDPGGILTTRHNIT